MGVSIKTAGGIAITGLVGFYLINKGLNYGKKAISELVEASKWKNYYRYGKDGKMMPPGYSEMVIPDKPDREYVHPDVAKKREKQEEREAKAEEKGTQGGVDFKPIADAVVKVVDSLLYGKNDRHGGYTTPSYAKYYTREIHDETEGNTDGDIPMTDELEKLRKQAEKEAEEQGQEEYADWKNDMVDEAFTGEEAEKRDVDIPVTDEDEDQNETEE